MQDYLTTVLRREIGTDAPITHRWAGIVSYTDDKLPIIEEVRPGIMAVGAYSGTGNVIGCAAGREAAAWALGRPTPLRDLIDQVRPRLALGARSEVPVAIERLSREGTDAAAL